MTPPDPALSLALEIAKRNARLRAWAAVGVPVKGHWSLDEGGRPTAVGSGVWSVIERERGICSPCSGDGRFALTDRANVHPCPYPEELSTCEACGGTGKRPLGPERGAYLSLTCTEHGLQLGTFAWIPMEHPLEALVQAEREHVGGHCPHLAPLLSPSDPPDVAAIAELELLAGG